MSAYTADESIVREFYVEAAYALGTDPSEGVREFDRFIARIKAEAWDEGAQAGSADARAVNPGYPAPTPNPYREEESK